jgi:Tol biopolymer transport system component
MKRASFAGLAAAIVVVAPAEATFPGANGRIAYTWSVGGNAFESGPNPRLVGIVSIRPDGRDRRLIARRGRQPAYSPDGREIAFVRSSRVWVARADGSRAQAITPRGWLIGAHRWSPGGKHIAFDRGFENSVRTALYTVAPHGGGVRRLVRAPMPISVGSGAWSPNGKALVYEQSSVGGRSLVRVIRGGRITTIARPGYRPTWSRRGLIAYEAPVPGEDRIQVCLSRLEPRAAAGCIAFQGASVSNPTWSPDGRRLMVTYTATGGGATELWALRPDGTVLTRVTGAQGFPIFSPNGRMLAYSAARFAGDPRLQYTDLFVQTADAKRRRRLVRGGQAESPDWQPLPPRRHAARSR